MVELYKADEDGSGFTLKDYGVEGCEEKYAQQGFVVVRPDQPDKVKPVGSQLIQK